MEPVLSTQQRPHTINVRVQMDILELLVQQVSFLENIVLLFHFFILFCFHCIFRSLCSKSLPKWWDLYYELSNEPILCLHVSKWTLGKYLWDK